MNALDGAPWLLAMARVFERAGAPLYLVGGAVRNPLMGLPLSDVDVCGPARPEAVLALCEDTALTARLRAAHFGTVELYVTDAYGARHMAEYTTFREDSYRCGHRPDHVRFTDDLAVDALRRDFSVNALYQRLCANGLLPVIDPTGGLAHLREGVLHTVTPNPDQVLKDDGLRILRAARFQAELGLAPTPALRDGLRRHAPLLAEIAPERLRDELAKIVMADLRYPMLPRTESGTASGLRTLRECGAWPFVLGEIGWEERAVDALARCGGSGPQSEAAQAAGARTAQSEATEAAQAAGARTAQSEAIAGTTPDATGTSACEAALQSLPARMALLFHRGGGDAVGALLEGLRFSARDAKEAALLADTLRGLLHGTMEAFAAARAGQSAVRFAALALGALGEETASARAFALERRLACVPASLRELAVDGRDLLPLFQAHGCPVSRMGCLLTELWRMTVEESLPNEKSTLLAAAERRIVHA